MKGNVKGKNFENIVANYVHYLKRFNHNQNKKSTTMKKKIQEQFIAIEFGPFVGYSTILLARTLLKHLSSSQNHQSTPHGYDKNNIMIYAVEISQVCIF